MASTPDYNALLTGEPLAATDKHFGSYTLERRELGDLVLTTGSLVANDPLAFWQLKPFTRTVQAGRYPVTIYIAHLSQKSGNEDQRIAYALVRFKDGLPAKWEMALVAGQDISTLEPGYFFGYGVDAGTGGFMDAATAQHIKAMQQGLSYEESEAKYGDPLMKALNATYQHTRSWANYTVDIASGMNVVAFSSGWGDGSYPCYWGLDAGGETLCLLTDFHVFSSDEDDA